METCIVIRGYNSWVWDKPLAQLIKDFNKLAKKYGGKFDEKCSVDMFSGAKADLDELEIDDMGRLTWRKDTLTHVKIQ